MSTSGDVIIQRHGDFSVEVVIEEINGGAFVAEDYDYYSLLKNHPNNTKMYVPDAAGMELDVVIHTASSLLVTLDQLQSELLVATRSNERRLPQWDIRVTDSDGNDFFTPTWTAIIRDVISHD